VLAAALGIAYVVYTLLSGSGSLVARRPAAAISAPQAAPVQPAPAPSAPEAAVAPAPAATTSAPQPAATAPAATPAPAAQTPAAVSPPPAAAKEPGVWYKIKWGDTLWDLAYAYYRNPWYYPRIAKANKIKNPDLIISGNRIWIPKL